MRKVTFENYCELVEIYYSIKQMGWRYGQTQYNVLTWERPDLARKVKGTDIDPFLEEKDDFLPWLKKNW